MCQLLENVTLALTEQNPCINKAIHGVLINTWIQNFACKIPGLSQNLSSSHRTRIVANGIL